MGSTSKVSAGDGGAVLEDVPHLTDWLPDLPVIIPSRGMGSYETGFDVERLGDICSLFAPIGRRSFL